MTEIEVQFISGKSAKERQAKFRQAQLKRGFKSVTVWVPENEAASLQLLARRLCEDTDLEVRSDALRNARTGRFEKL